ncbi:MAG: shikimate kinase [Kiritimatiellia bacterium]
MSASPNIVLVGFMGSGKSTAGKNVARLLGRRFIDVDEQIEMREGCSIPEIFARKGEESFRELEREIIRFFAAQGGLVIACGGGAVKDPVNVERLKARGVVYCLTASPATVLERVGRCNHRPLLAGPDREARLTALLAERKPLYDQFENQVSTDGREPEAVAEEICRHFTSRAAP